MMNDLPPPTEGSAYNGIAEGKRLLRTVRAGSLATHADGGAPFASLVAVATTPDGSPLLLLSRLATHTRHLEADPRCALLLAERGRGDALAHPRLTVTGQAIRLDESRREAARRRFLARNPKAALYVDFPDFGFWRLEITEGHMVGGFGRAAALSPDRLLTDVAGADALLTGESGAVEHMNADHADALALYATVMCGAPEGAWRATGLDPEGMDLLWGDHTARLPFPHPVTTPGDLRTALVTLAKQARERGDDTPRR